ncbi:cytochrome p450 monooxygenase [Grosmannia clavigera kw1407]|uniref:Cytochrome p450 monooxygenase n=1 Tax=Grosmannia clavigera (strain kw1407 / UAMH 11150) TaxID=655863 RepID=F0XM03_GROCL|nr:cytochrome p450 monooxygenase [Grosmannia clavigera kw1407]EFX01165.1 cytochrome p450 monooxygenase [Grosmannia clavigera kw1407]
MSNCTATPTSFFLQKYNIFSKIDSCLDRSIAVRAIIATPTWPTGRLSCYVAAACVLLAVYIIRPAEQQKPNFPFYKAAKAKWIFDAEILIRHSYNKFYDRVYQIKATEGLQVLIPARFISELKGLPEHILSATEAVNDAMLSKYTKFSLGHNGDMLSAVIRTKLTQNLARLVPQLRKEIEYVVATEFPTCDAADWTPVKVHPFGLRAIARLSGRAFVGLSISRKEEWMDTSINFAIHVFMAVIRLQFIPSWLRPIGQYLVTDLRRIRADITRGQAMLQPIIEERLRDMDTPGYEKPDDLIQWLLDTLPPSERHDYRAQTEMQLVLSAASIHTTNNLLADCIFDLAAYPGVQDALRQESIEVLCNDEAWARKDSLARLKKMDSFIKEVQRVSGNITGFIRKVMRPIVLSDGTHLPSGTRLLAPQAGYSQDERFYPGADVFDPMRFFQQRSGHQFHFTSIGDANMNFGAGKHACPGRFFAGNEIKMMLAYYLINFEMKLQQGQRRPYPMMVMMSKTPDPNGEVLFRRRTVDRVDGD